MSFRRFENMCWPVPSERTEEVSWRLRWGNPTNKDLMLAASIISAYEQLITLPQKTRNKRITELHKGPNV